jgi:hypothetical protein
MSEKAKSDMDAATNTAALAGLYWFCIGCEPFEPAHFEPEILVTYFTFHARHGAEFDAEPELRIRPSAGAMRGGGANWVPQLPPRHRYVPI